MSGVVRESEVQHQAGRCISKFGVRKCIRSERLHWKRRVHPVPCNRVKNWDVRAPGRPADRCHRGYGRIGLFGVVAAVVMDVVIGMTFLDETVHGHGATCGTTGWPVIATTTNQTRNTSIDASTPEKLRTNGNAPTLLQYMCWHPDLESTDESMWTCGEGTNNTINACYVAPEARFAQYDETKPYDPAITAGNGHECETMICIPGPCTVLEIDYQQYSRSYKDQAPTGNIPTFSLFGKMKCGAAWGRGMSNQLLGDLTPFNQPDDLDYYKSKKNSTNVTYAWAPIDGTDDPALMEWHINDVIEGSQCAFPPGTVLSNMDSIRGEGTTNGIVSVVYASNTEAAAVQCTPKGDAFSEYSWLTVWSNDVTWTAAAAAAQAALTQPKILDITSMRPADSSQYSACIKPLMTDLFKKYVFKDDSSGVPSISELLTRIRESGVFDELSYTGHLTNDAGRLMGIPPTRSDNIANNYWTTTNTTNQLELQYIKTAMHYIYGVCNVLYTPPDFAAMVAAVRSTTLFTPTKGIVDSCSRFCLPLEEGLGVLDRGGKPGHSAAYINFARALLYMGSTGSYTDHSYYPHNHHITLDEHAIPNRADAIYVNDWTLSIGDNAAISGYGVFQARLNSDDAIPEACGPQSGVSIYESLAFALRPPPTSPEPQPNVSSDIFKWNVKLVKELGRVYTLWENEYKDQKKSATDTDAYTNFVKEKVGLYADSSDAPPPDSHINASEWTTANPPYGLQAISNYIAQNIWRYATIRHGLCTPTQKFPPSVTTPQLDINDALIKTIAGNSGPLWDPTHFVRDDVKTTCCEPITIFTRQVLKTPLPPITISGSVPSTFTGATIGSYGFYDPKVGFSLPSFNMGHTFVDDNNKPAVGTGAQPQAWGLGTVPSNYENADDTGQIVVPASSTSVFSFICRLTMNCESINANPSLRVPQISITRVPMVFRRTNALSSTPDRMKAGNLPLYPLGNEHFVDPRYETCGSGDDKVVIDTNLLDRDMIQDVGQLEFNAVACAIWGYCDRNGTWAPWHPTYGKLGQNETGRVLREKVSKCCSCHTANYIANTSDPNAMYKTAQDYPNTKAENATRDNSKIALWWPSDQPPPLARCSLPAGHVNVCNLDDTKTATVADMFPTSGCIMTISAFKSAVCGEPETLDMTTGERDTDIVNGQFRLHPINGDAGISSETGFDLKKGFDVGTMGTINGNRTRAVEVQFGSDSNYPGHAVFVTDDRVGAKPIIQGGSPTFWLLKNEAGTVPDVSDPCFQRTSPTRVQFMCNDPIPGAPNIQRCTLVISSAWDNKMPNARVGCKIVTFSASADNSSRPLVQVFGNKKKTYDEDTCKVPSTFNKGIKPQNPCKKHNDYYGNTVLRDGIQNDCNVKNGSFNYADAGGTGNDFRDQKSNYTQGVCKGYFTSYSDGGPSQNPHCGESHGFVQTGVCNDFLTPMAPGQKRQQTFIENAKNGFTYTCAPSSCGMLGYTQFPRSSGKCFSHFTTNANCFLSQSGAPQTRTEPIACTAWDAVDIFRWCTDDTKIRDDPGVPRTSFFDRGWDVPLKDYSDKTRSNVDGNTAETVNDNANDGAIFAQCCSGGFAINPLVQDKNTWPDGYTTLERDLVGGNYEDDNCKGNDNIKTVLKTLFSKHARDLFRCIKQTDNFRCRAKLSSEKGDYAPCPWRDQSLPQGPQNWNDDFVRAKDWAKGFTKVQDLGSIDDMSHNGGLYDMSGQSEVQYTGPGGACSTHAPTIKTKTDGYGALHSPPDYSKFLKPTETSDANEGRLQYVIDSVQWDMFMSNPVAAKSWVNQSVSPDLVQDPGNLGGAAPNRRDALLSGGPTVPYGAGDNVPFFANTIGKDSSYSCDCGRASPVYACELMNFDDMTQNNFLGTFGPAPQFAMEVNYMVCGWSWDFGVKGSPFGIGLFVPSAPGSSSMKTIERDVLGDPTTSNDDLSNFFLEQGAPDDTALKRLISNLSGNGDDFNPPLINNSAGTITAKVQVVEYPGSCIRWPYGRLHRNLMANSSKFFRFDRSRIMPTYNGGLSAPGDEALYSYCERPGKEEMFVFCNHDKMSPGDRKTWCALHPEANTITVGVVATADRTVEEACYTNPHDGESMCVFIKGDPRFPTPTSLWLENDKPNTAVIVAPFSTTVSYGMQAGVALARIDAKPQQPKQSVAEQLSSHDFTKTSDPHIPETILYVELDDLLVLSSLKALASLHNGILNRSMIETRLETLHSKAMAFTDAAAARAAKSKTRGCQSGSYSPPLGEFLPGDNYWESYQCALDADFFPVSPPMVSVVYPNSSLVSGHPTLPLSITTTATACNAIVVSGVPQFTAADLEIRVAEACQTPGIGSVPIVFTAGDNRNAAISVKIYTARTATMCISGYDMSHPRPTDSIADIDGAEFQIALEEPVPNTLGHVALALVHSNGELRITCLEACTVLVQDVNIPTNPIIRKNGFVQIIDISALTSIYGLAFETAYFTAPPKQNTALLVLAFTFGLTTIGLLAVGANARATTARATTNKGKDGAN